MPIGWEPGEGAGWEEPTGGLTPAAAADLANDPRNLTGEVWTRWRTAEDERVCPECGPLDGQAWPAGSGPLPPLHNGCRCARDFAFVAWGTR